MQDFINKPRPEAFFQQKLKAWQPIYTPSWVLGTFYVLGVVLLVLGIVITIASQDITEYSVQYDGKGADLKDCSIDKMESKTCEIKFNIDKDLKQPIYIFYGLENFYQNHRRYQQSINNDQMTGKYPSNSTLEDDCDPMYKGKDNKYLYPCGLIANSFFNDTFKLMNSEYLLYENDITWKDDVKSKYKNPSERRPGYQYINDTYPMIQWEKSDDETSSAYYGGGVQDEHFIVWMRTAALPNFRKLYGRITEDIQKGTVLTFRVNANFPVSHFDGKKYLVLSTTSWIGGKNGFLGLCYIVIGSISIVVGIIFTVKVCLYGRKLGDISKLNWLQTDEMTSSGIKKIE